MGSHSAGSETPRSSENNSAATKSYRASSLLYCTHHSHPSAPRVLLHNPAVRPRRYPPILLAAHPSALAPLTSRLAQADASACPPEITSQQQISLLLLLLLLFPQYERHSCLPRSAPSHGHPDNTAPSTQNVDRASTASHPPTGKPDPTTYPSHGAQGGFAAANASGPAELSRLKVNLRSALRQFPDFPLPGILFEDIMPIFADHTHFTNLMRALELQVAAAFNTTVGEKSGIDVVVGLESRGFLFGPTLALRLGAGFVPVRKQGKLPGKCVTEGYQKEYGTDYFQVQEDAIKPGQKVIIVDDIIATGKSW
jgi:adenine phosphoribosyltransferase